MNTFIYAFLIAGGISLVWLALDYILIKGEPRDDYRWVALSAAFGVSLVLNLIILYWNFPNETGLFWGKGWWMVTVFIAGVAFGLANMARSGRDVHISVAPVLAGLLVLWYAIWGIGAAIAPFSNDGANELANILTVEDAPLGEYPESDPAHIVQVNAEIAEFKASQSMASGGSFNDRPLESVFEPGKPVLQQVNDHLYWVVDLRFVGWREAGGVSNTVPGYIVVDAEDPSAAPEFRLGFEMDFVPSGFFGEKLERHIYSNGYRDVVLDDLTIEVDDEWNPYYTLAINDYLHSHHKNGLRPVGFLIIDPQTGEIEEYDLDEIPEWVDRVYSASTIKDRLNDWGRWANADRNIFKETKANRFDVSGEPGLVYTDDGRAVWQVLMTSKNADTSASSVILVDARTGEAKRYSTTSGVTIEDNVIDVMRSSADNIRKHEPVNPQLYRIYGELSWVATFVPNDESGASSSFAGIALLPASQADPSSVAYSSNTLGEALRMYRQQLAGIEGGADPNQESASLAVEGVVADIGSAVINGNTTFFIRLEGEDETFIGPVGENTDLPFVEVGDSVRIRFIDVNNPTREVDIVSLSILAAAS